MMRSLLLSLIFLVPTISSAQERTFNYFRKGNYVQFTSGKDLIGFESYQSKGANTQVRSVQTANGLYKLVIHKSDSGKVKTVMNAKDSVVATVLLYGKNRNNIVLADGRMLKYNALAKHTGSYTSNGKEAFTYTIENTKALKAVIVLSHDQTIPTEALQIICFEHSAEVLYKVNHMVVVIGVAVVVAVIGAAAGG